MCSPVIKEGWAEEEYGNKTLKQHIKYSFISGLQNTRSSLTGVLLLMMSSIDGFALLVRMLVSIVVFVMISVTGRRLCCCPAAVLLADFVFFLMIRRSGQVDAEDMTTSCPGHDLSVKGVVGRRGPFSGSL